MAYRLSGALCHAQYWSCHEAIHKDTCCMFDKRHTLIASNKVVLLVILVLKQVTFFFFCICVFVHISDCVNSTVEILWRPSRILVLGLSSTA